VEVNIHLERFLIFLLIAGIVAILTRRFRIPYTVGLVFTGVILSFHSFFFDVPFTKDIIFNVFLPPLVFEAALQIHWKELRRELPVVLLLATVGVCLAWGVTALGMRYLAGWGWTSALLFGILIAATDPVSVVATFEEAGVHGRLRLLVESESLLNDGTAAVGFGVILALTAGGTPSAAGIAKTLIVTIAGGMLCGGVVAGTVIALARRTTEHLVEIVFTTFAAYASFLLAEHFHFSGVLASMTAGLIMGNARPLGVTSPKGKESVASYWEFLNFLANSLIFMGIGIQLSHQKFAGLLVPSIIAILLVLLGRVFAVYPCCAVFSRAALRVKSRHQHVLFWGGLRGALALALAVGLPSGLPQQAVIVSVSFAVVTFSVFAQGLTMTPLLRRMGELPPDELKGKAEDLQQ
jgi:monovalent cation:H+ antiporter, CPA1 family